MSTRGRYLGLIGFDARRREKQSAEVFSLLAIKNRGESRRGEEGGRKACVVASGSELRFTRREKSGGRM